MRGAWWSSGPVRQIFKSPAHPYTKALLNSIPRMSDNRQRLTAIDGQPPDLVALPPGCSFAPRCPSAFDRCREAAPPERTFGDQTHRALLACSRRAPLPPTPTCAKERLDGRARGGRAQQALPGAARVLRRRPRHGARGRRHLVCDRGRAHARRGRRIRAAARPRPPSSCSASRSRPAAASASRARTSRGSTRPGAGTIASRCRPCSRTPTPRSTRACASARSSPSR